MRKLLDPTTMRTDTPSEIVSPVEHESRYIHSVVNHFGGNLTHVATALGITRNTLKARLRGKRGEPTPTKSIRFRGAGVR